jgi:hypothetical protein
LKIPAAQNLHFLSEISSEKNQACAKQIPTTLDASMLSEAKHPVAKESLSNMPNFIRHPILRDTQDGAC